MKKLLLLPLAVLLVTASLTKAQSHFSTDSTVLFTNPENLYVKGQFDAEKYYTKYKAAGTATLLTSLVSPIIGLLPAIPASATSPKIDNLGYPDPNLIKQQDYYLGYTQKAKKIKQRKVWTNWGIGLGANLIAVLIINASR